MSPLMIEILLHYFARTNDYRDGDFSASAVRDAITWFHEHEHLLEQTPVGPRHAAYVLTDRGRVYVEALLSVPLPVQKWVMP